MFGIMIIITIIIIVIIIIILTPNIFSLLHPLVQSRTWTLWRTAPSQT